MKLIQIIKKESNIFMELLVIHIITKPIFHKMIKTYNQILAEEIQGKLIITNQLIIVHRVKALHYMNKLQINQLYFK